jgi:POT family proton-dependent oligopeptide transporter
MNEMADRKEPDAVVPASIPDKHPPAIWFFFWGEFAERSSYYGMRTILFLYITQVIGFTTRGTNWVYTPFKMGCYFLPLLGGWLADRWFGRYWTIVGFSVPYILGHFILGIPNEIALIIALILLAGGSGVIKPNISTLLGQTYDKQRPGNEHLRTSAFLWFYFAINIGAFLSQLSLPEVRDRHMLANLSPELREQAEELRRQGEDFAKIVPREVKANANAVAFQVPAWLMVISLTIFAAGKRFYYLEKREPHILTQEERRLQWRTLVRLLGIFLLVILFWIGYEHSDTLWIAFNRDYVNLRVPLVGRSISPDQLQWLNALFVIILVPTFSFLFRRYDPDIKIFTPMRKVFAGFVLTAFAIGIMSVAGFQAQGRTDKISMLWPASAYIVLTFGEVLLYGTMLELAYTAAPKSMKGFITACFLVTNALGNLVNLLWVPFYGGSLTDPIDERGPLQPGPFFAITASFVVVATIGFIFVGKRFERAEAEQKNAGMAM